MQKPLNVFFLIGRPGSGKGTQLSFLKEMTGFDVVKTGNLLRERAREKDIIGKKIKEVLSEGKLIPTPIVFSLWMPLIIDYFGKNTRGLIFDGNPRKLYEAHMLEELFSMLDFKEPIALYVKISEEEARKRLLKRGREDDREEDIRERLRWFKEEVMPVVDYYAKKDKLIEINGEQSPEAVWKETEEKIKYVL